MVGEQVMGEAWLLLVLERSRYGEVIEQFMGEAWLVLVLGRGR